MGSKVIEQWTCDLCGAERRDQLQNKNKWVKFDIEDSFLDRSWHTKVLCGSCLESLQCALRNRKE